MKILLLKYSLLLSIFTINIVHSMDPQPLEKEEISQSICYPKIRPAQVDYSNYMIKKEDFTLDSEKFILESTFLEPTFSLSTVRNENPFKNIAAILEVDTEEHSGTTIKIKDGSDILYTGLSIDGGGMRGYIPALFLQKLEDALGGTTCNKTHIYELFDCIGGSSVGGILALGCTVSTNKRTPILEHADLTELFSKEGKNIFPKMSLNKILSWGGMFSVKYPSVTNLEELLRIYFKSTSLKDTLTNVLITGVETNTSEPYLFRSYGVKKENEEDFFIRDIARATAAPPSYLPAAKITSLNNLQKTRTFADGGIWAPNPSWLVYSEVTDIFKTHPQNVYILSLGTGNTEVKRNETLPDSSGMLSPRLIKSIIGSKFRMDSSGVDMQMKKILKQNYQRFQPQIDSEIELDNTSIESFEIFEKSAENMYPSIEEVARKLIENKYKRHGRSL